MSDGLPIAKIRTGHEPGLQLFADQRVDDMLAQLEGEGKAFALWSFVAEESDEIGITATRELLAKSLDRQAGAAARRLIETFPYKRLRGSVVVAVARGPHDYPMFLKGESHGHGNAFEACWVRIDGGGQRTIVEHKNNGYDHVSLSCEVDGINPEHVAEYVSVNDLKPIDAAEFNDQLAQFRERLP